MMQCVYRLATSCLAAVIQPTLPHSRHQSLCQLHLVWIHNLPAKVHSVLLRCLGLVGQRLRRYNRKTAVLSDPIRSEIRSDRIGYRCNTAQSRFDDNILSGGSIQKTLGDNAPTKLWRLKRRVGWNIGKVLPPNRLGSLEKRRQLLQRGPGRLETQFGVF